jgi:hypothetical protein
MKQFICRHYSNKCTLLETSVNALTLQIIKHTKKSSHDTQPNTRNAKREITKESSEKSLRLCNQEKK